MAPVSIIDSLRQQITSCEARLKDLRRQLAEAELLQQQQQRADQERSRQNAGTVFDPLAHDMIYGIHDDFRSEVFAVLSQQGDDASTGKKWPLDMSEYKRYGRQLIMPEVGLQGTRLAFPS